MERNDKKLGMRARVNKAESLARHYEGMAVMSHMAKGESPNLKHYEIHSEKAFQYEIEAGFEKIRASRIRENMPFKVRNSPAARSWLAGEEIENRR
jgi:hypothetical protein